jgi:hypothetical protein
MTITCFIFVLNLNIHAPAHAGAETANVQRPDTDLRARQAVAVTIITLRLSDIESGHGDSNGGWAPRPLVSTSCSVSMKNIHLTRTQNFVAMNFLRNQN